MTERKSPRPLSWTLRCSAALVLGLLVSTLPAGAWSYETCGGTKRTWNGDSVVFNPSTVSFSGTFRTALDRAANAWNAVPGAQFRLNLVYDDATTLSFGDGKNSIGFITDPDFFDGALAVEVTDYETCFLINDGNMKESDIVFNSDFTWETSGNPFPPRFNAVYNVSLVGMHEMGHGFGLRHENNRLATMNSFYPDGGVFGNNNTIQPHADDALGDRAGYGTCCTRHDVAASAYESLGGGSSDHIASPTTAERGHSTFFRFTLENRGTTNEGSVRAQFYLSTNRFISTGDTLLGSATFSLNAGTTSTLGANVTIPVSVASGTYTLGVIADPNNTIAEVDEGNNAVGLARTVFVPTTSHPIACFTATPTFGTEPLQVTFNAFCSSDPDGSISSYTWSFGDGSSGSGVNPTHFYGAGNFTVTLTVRDNSGLTDQDFDNIFVTGDCGGFIICEEPL